MMFGRGMVMKEILDRSSWNPKQDATNFGLILNSGMTEKLNYGDYMNQDKIMD